MKTITLTDEMVNKLKHFVNLPEDYLKEEDLEFAMDIIDEINNELFKK